MRVTLRPWIAVPVGGNSESKDRVIWNFDKSQYIAVATARNAEEEENVKLLSTAPMLLNNLAALAESLNEYRDSFETVIGASLPEPLNKALQDANALLSGFATLLQGTPGNEEGESA